METTTIQCRECKGVGIDCDSCHGTGRHPVALADVLAHAGRGDLIRFDFSRETITPHPRRDGRMP